ncbi:GTP 3',8-cyclase MoaA [Helicobacter sp.]|uniref:GTP 3',8-cyclase MoaA n=1 Tax=Helicobacter sp. TaxID=218 RepID=UPI0025C12E80|nr:GTP 3',8-cyclase MoaA [Helicobacter sp.]MCI5968832.1 GTP 3',8-cyclase MoaA [Helicobacter sp.]MDY2585017.1 GTP 3',8-cyclase MoaA [Helicobacter sp.]
MLVDSFGRTIDYMRISVTERCNFRCAYCMPNTPMDIGNETQDVPLDAILNFIQVAINAGVKKIRITGGEPLLRSKIVEFIANICKIAPHIDIALTTNAFLLAPIAQDLKNAGLKRINISLDSLNKEHIKCISKRDGLDKILLGIQSARKAGLKIKLNMVPLRGINDSEIVEILEYAIGLGVMVRYIEFMENTHARSEIRGLKLAEILEYIRKKYQVQLFNKETFGPAVLFKIPQKEIKQKLNCALEQDYIFGVIAPHNDDFCKTCNRIRLSSEGKLIPCLYHENAISVKEAMLEGNTQEILERLKLCISTKPEKNDWNANAISKRAFYQTGG